MEGLQNRCTVIGSMGESGNFGGRCRIIWNDGDIFEGFVRDNELVVGEMSYAGGDIYRGEYLHGLMHGKGTYFYFDGRTYTGHWSEGKRSGYGELCSSVEGEAYRGTFQNGLREGYGEQLFGNGVKFCGQFSYDEINGFGVMSYADGSAHCGKWKTVMQREMLTDGQAIYIQNDGQRLLENWKSGKIISARALRRRREEVYELAKRQEAPVWQDDSSSETCNICDTPFSLTVRRSHCRSCGWVVCGECIKTLKLSWKSKPSKVCDDCFIIRNTLHLS